MTLRSGNACLAMGALMILSGGVVSPALAQDRALAGQVIDPRGAAVGEATVFVTPVGRARVGAEVRAGLRADGAAHESIDRVLKSGPDGTFSVLLPVGRYRLAAFKPGFEVALAEVNLTARATVEVRMRPQNAAPGAPPEDSAGAGRGLDWILRRAEADVLRDLEAGPDGGLAFVKDRAGFEGRMEDRGLRLPPVDGEFMQDFSGSSLFAGGLAGPGDASGRSTRLALRGAAGGQGSWRFDGLSGRTSAMLSEGDETRRGRTTTGLGVGFDYRLGPGDLLETEVRYATSRYLFDAGASADGVDQEQKSAALRARWDRRLGDEALLYVVGSYLEAAVRQPSAGPVLLAPEDHGGENRGRLADRSVGAAAGLAFRSDAHQIGLGARLHSYRYDLGDGGALLSGVDSRPVPLESGRNGSALSLFGEDDWQIADRHVVNYGVGYHNDFSTGSAYVVPRVGLTSTLLPAGNLRMRSALMYRVDDGRLSLPALSGADRGDPARSGTRLGYEVGVDGRPDGRLEFAATLSYRPYQDALEGRRAAVSPAGLLDEGVVLLSDAAAGRHEMEIEVRRGFGFVRGALLGSVGRVQGRLSPVLSEAPLRDLQTGEARYYLTALRATIEPTDTEVRIDYRRVVGEMDPGAHGQAGTLDYRRLDLAVLQDLPFVPFASSRWRVLMGYQGLMYGAPDRSSATPGTGVTSRVTGGVDISF